MAIESLSTDRSPTPEALLQELGRQGASGVLEISHPGEDVSYAWFREGRIYAMHVPGYRPALGIRLLSGGILSPEQLSAAAAEQRERFPTHLIGQVLVGMGLVSTEVIDAFVQEQVLDQVADLLDLPVEDSAFHPGRRIQQDIITPTDVDELLEIARQRRAHRCDILAAVGGPHVVPALGPPGNGPAQTPLGPYDWALLCRVDGTRDVTELARVCGFTVQEAAQIVSDLALTGLLVIPPRPAPPDEPLAPVVTLHPEADDPDHEPDWQFVGTDVGEPEPVGNLLAEFSAFVHDGPGAPEPSAPEVVPSISEVTLAEAALEIATLAGAGTAAPDPTPSAVHPDQHSAVELPTDPDQPHPWVALPGAATHDGAASEHAEGLPPHPLASADPMPADPMPAHPAPSDLRPAHDDAAARLPTADPTRGPGQGTSPFPAGAPVAPPAQEGYSDTSVFMRELSSLSDEPESDAPVVTRLVVPLTEQRRKRRFWSR
jgi:hypothetical protein